VRNGARRHVDDHLTVPRHDEAAAARRLIRPDLGDLTDDRRIDLPLLADG
jgi:hypothetical protein